TRFGNAENVQLNGSSYVSNASIIVINENMRAMGLDHKILELREKYKDKMDETPVQARKKRTSIKIFTVRDEEYTCVGIFIARVVGDTLSERNASIQEQLPPGLKTLGFLLRVPEHRGYRTNQTIPESYKFSWGQAGSTAKDSIHKNTLIEWGLDGYIGQVISNEQFLEIIRNKPEFTEQVLRLETRRASRPEDGWVWC
ncbi:MAG TPA: hypothetical protein VFM18_08410, partial [Methanosarcina sp.]|nr:hypothetical protein [Methanosarcina sp.]